MANLSLSLLNGSLSLSHSSRIMLSCRELTASSRTCLCRHCLAHFVGGQEKCTFAIDIYYVNKVIKELKKSS